MFSDYRLTANYDMCSLNSISLWSQLCFIPSFSSTFIHTKAFGTTYLSSMVPTSSLHHFQIILYLLVHEIILKLFNLESRCLSVLTQPILGTSSPLWYLSYPAKNRMSLSSLSHPWVKIKKGKRHSNEF